MARKQPKKSPFSLNIHWTNIKKNQSPKMSFGKEILYVNVVEKKNNFNVFLYINRKYTLYCMLQCYLLDRWENLMTWSYREDKIGYCLGKFFFYFIFFFSFVWVRKVVILYCGLQKMWKNIMEIIDAEYYIWLCYCAKLRILKHCYFF